MSRRLIQTPAHHPDHVCSISQQMRGVILNYIITPAIGALIGMTWNSKNFTVVGIGKLSGNQTAPLGATGVSIAGITSGALLGLGALYAKSIGMGIGEISLFIGASYIGGMILQWPIGLLSDRQDRRVTILWVGIVGALTAMIVPLGAGMDNRIVMMIGMFTVGAFTFPMYSLASSHMNDQLRPEQILSASSGMILLNGLGGMMGPLVAASLMDIFSIQALFLFIASMNLVVALMAAYRINVQPPMVIEDQGDQIQVALAVSPVATAEMLVEADSSTPVEEEVHEVEIKL